MRVKPKTMFVYTLRHGDRVFYVGVTCDAERRSRDHGCGSSYINDFINSLKGEVKMVVEFECPYEEAFKREKETIQKYTQEGHVLINGNHRIEREARFAAAIKRSKLRHLVTNK